MAHTNDAYSDLASVFDQHEVTLDVTLADNDVWSSLKFCADTFAREHVAFVRSRKVADDQVSLRIECQSVDQVRRLEKAFRRSDPPTTVEWTVTIGKKLS